MNTSSLLKSKASLLVLFWLVLLGGMLCYYQLPLLIGQEVTVVVQPVDPRDLFRGDYVILSYDFSEFDPSLFLGEATPVVGSTIYASLQEDENGVSMLKSFSEVGGGEGVVLKGVVKESWSSNQTISYGVESFFVPEGHGRVIEQIRNTDRLKAVLVVDPWGRAIIKNLLFDDEVIELGNLPEIASSPEIDLGSNRQSIRDFENEVEVTSQITEHVVTIPFSEDWEYQDGILTHKNLTAKWSIDVSEEKGSKEGFDCLKEKEQRGEQVVFCGKKEMDWQSYQMLEYIENESYYKIIKRIATPHILEKNGEKRVYTISMSVQESEYAGLKEEIEDMVMAMWVRDY
ncbi:MAG: GDYXXLXY domain-containing protein [Candidatus Gracilibacteria bacterium]|nr:GDYXXLXY domain-containing protein [Candidatus Gracilibacteria bacterium]